MSNSMAPTPAMSAQRAMLYVRVASSSLMCAITRHCSSRPVGGGSDKGGFQWLAGDHHIHTQYSSDAQYRVLDQAKHGHAYGLDWLVITDHGSNEHAKIGVEKVNPDIRKTREIAIRRFYAQFVALSE